MTKAILYVFAAWLFAALLHFSGAMEHPAYFWLLGIASGLYMDRVLQRQRGE